jgi:cytochrome oxidase Cu insertion factor (SCO1/SenC/PrrC family)
LKICSTAVAVVVFFSVTGRAGELGSKQEVPSKPTDLNRVRVGDKAPDFALENMNGTVISLSDFRGKKNVVLVFYRGHW